LDGLSDALLRLRADGSWSFVPAIGERAAE
jgi:hypothetical protein